MIYLGNMLMERILVDIIKKFNFDFTIRKFTLL
jgi:hypothetical protein